jgi:hypothetical protein
MGIMCQESASRSGDVLARWDRGYAAFLHTNPPRPQPVDNSPREITKTNGLGHRRRPLCKILDATFREVTF